MIEEVKGITEAQVVENAPESTKTIGEDHLKKLVALRDQMEEMTRMIGTLEIQKMRISLQHMNAGGEMKEVIRESLLSVGVEEKDIPSYRINMETGSVDCSEK